MKRSSSLLLITRKKFDVKKIRSLEFDIADKVDLKLTSDSVKYMFSVIGQSTNIDQLVIAFKLSSDLEKVEGLHLSPNNEIGFYHYLEVSQYRKSTDIEFVLPSSTTVESVRIISWNVNEKTKNIYFDRMELKVI